MKLYAAILLAILALAAVLQRTEAHAGLQAMEPEAGAVLSASPQEIRLTFDTLIDVESSLILFAAGFREIPGVRAIVDQTQLVATLPLLEPDSYFVQWSVYSGDGHEAVGSYGFTIATRSRNNFPAVLILLLLLFIGGLIFRRNRAV